MLVIAIIFALFGLIFLIYGIYESIIFKNPERCVKLSGTVVDYRERVKYNGPHRRISIYPTIRYIYKDKENIYESKAPFTATRRKLDIGESVDLYYDTKKDVVSESIDSKLHITGGIICIALSVFLCVLCFKFGA